MKPVYITIFILFLASVNLHSQETKALTGEKTIILETKIIGADTLPHITLREVSVVPTWRFKNSRQKKRYSKLVINVKKTLPYARLASKKLRAIEAHMHTLNIEKERKVYLKKAEKEMFSEFEKPLRHLTFSQGRLLIRLIDRETGDTSYNLIKEYKGGFSAFFWQSVARIFGSNLKAEFDPDGDQKMIEHIIILIDNGML